MFLVLFRKELLENVHNYHFLLALVLCLIVIPLGFYINQQDYVDRRQVYDEALRDYDQSRKTVADILQQGASAFRPPAPLGFLSGGVEMILPSAAETLGYISQEGANVQFNNTRRLNNPLIWLFGRLDLAFIVSTVLAFLVIIFTFNAVAGEKERGTLAQVIANPVPRPLVIAAKMAAGSTLLTGAFLAGVLGGIVLTAALGIEPFGLPGTQSAFCIGIGASLLFLLVFYSFGLLISSISWNPASAMVTLLSIWVTLAMILPKGSVIMARFLVPVKSQQVVDLEKRRVRFQAEKNMFASLMELAESTPGIKDMSRDEYFRQKRAKNPMIATFEKTQAQRQDDFTAKLNIELGKIDFDFEQNKERQAALARNLSRISPISCLVHILTELAGTGFTEENAWRETRSAFKQILDREVASKNRSYSFADMTYGTRDLDRNAPAPKLPPQPVSLEKRLAAVWVDLVLLGIYGILFFAGAYVAFLRYDVR